MGNPAESDPGRKELLALKGPIGQEMIETLKRERERERETETESERERDGGERDGGRERGTERDK